MFTKPLNQIEFSEIEEFCRRFPEGVRVEYKREITAVPKIVSSFANTLGGIFIIGVETDANDMGQPRIEGIPNEPGNKERIEESAFTGIYPPVFPEVEICPVDEKPENVVVLVRVNESPQAPHVIENSTKSYIRVGSTTQPYKKPQLADIDTIEYLLKRRAKPQEICNHILNRTKERINSRWHLACPNLTVRARPTFLHRPLISRSEIYAYVKAQDRNPKGYILFNDEATDFGTRQVSGGVCFVGATVGLLYWELNEYGIICHAQKLHKSPFQDFHGPEDDEENRYLELNDLVYNTCELIAVAKGFYQRCQYSGNIEIAAQLRHVRGEKLMFGGEPHYSPIQRRQSLDSEISAHLECCARDINEFENSATFIVELVGQLLWGFNVNEDTWGEIVRDRIERWQNQYGAL